MHRYGPVTNLRVDHACAGFDGGLTASEGPSLILSFGQLGCRSKLSGNDQGCQRDRLAMLKGALASGPLALQMNASLMELGPAAHFGHDL